LKLCNDEDCNYPAVICEKEGCEASLKHKDCLTSTSIQEMIDKLMRRREGGIKILDPIS
jgi:hypothetical protein